MTNNNRKDIAVAAALVVATAVMAGALYLTTPKVYKVHFPLIYGGHKTLQSEFSKHGIRFGFAVGAGSFRNETTYTIIKNHAAIVGTECATKMEYTQPMRGMFDFTEADDIVDYAEELGIDVYGHSFSWSLQNPDWLDNGTFTYSELEYILFNHVNTLSHHFEGHLVGMDAANEGFLSCGPWCPLGTNTYVNTSLAATQLMHSNGPLRKPAAALFYNSIFPTRAEEEFALALLDTGSIDGIGLQLHLATTTDWKRKLDSTDAFLSRIRVHGGIVRFSEVGVHQQNDSESELQALIFAQVTKLAIKHQDIVIDYVVWGIIPPMWRGDTGLFDREGNPKSSYYSVMEALK